jgi:hypothetical protein
MLARVVLGFLFSLALAASSLAAKNDGWKRPPDVTRKLGIETFTCVQNEDDPEDHTLLCLGLGCATRSTYELVTIAGGGGIAGATALSSGPVKIVIELTEDAVSTQAFKWEVTRAPVGFPLLNDLARQKELKLKPAQGAERVLSLRNYPAELKRLAKFCEEK